MSSVKNGDLVILNSPFDKAEVIAFISSTKTTPGGAVETVNLAFEFDDISKPELAYELDENGVRNLVVENLGNHLEFFDSKRVEYKTILRYADEAMGPVTMAWAISKLAQPGTPTTEVSVKSIIQEATEEGKNRVRILQKQVDDILANLGSGSSS
ncbi:hypothetical protein ACKF11_12765 [Methylobacillus sp. Pita2]|uniref:hypothetical protein n=1 Tax=Methylobacillus sp. Pita2 TaxID=3383245 RepID=UPI0038B5FEB2